MGAASEVAGDGVLVIEAGELREGGVSGEGGRDRGGGDVVLRGDVRLVCDGAAGRRGRQGRHRSR